MKAIDKSIIFSFSMLCLFWACSKSDDSIITRPDVSYGQEIIAAFLTEGQTEAPEIDWNGNKGSFGLESASTIFTIDPLTGIISWSDQLGLGDHQLVILVSNNAGTTKAVLNVKGVLEGRFVGNYTPYDVTVDGLFELEYELKRDGTLSGSQRYQVMGEEMQGLFPFQGTWSEDENFLSGEYRFEEVGEPVAFLASLTVSDSGANLSGNYIDTFTNPNAVIHFDLDFISD